jgi:hypothetical protein
MKKMKKNEIQTIYSDALFWSISPMSKEKKYHISRLNESVLRKLIHYDKRNTKISYSSELIAKHTFLNVSQIEKTIPYLEKKGFIKCIHFTVKNKNGEKIKRRIININWSFIEGVLLDVPDLGNIEKENDFPEQLKTEVDDIKKESQGESIKNEFIEIPMETILSNIDFNVNDYLTKRKLKFAERFYNEDFKLEILYTLDKKTLDDFFYFNDKIWKLKTIEEDNEDHWENINGVNLYYSGFGTQLKLYKLNKNDVVTDSFRINWNDLDKYMLSNGITFGDVTLDNYDNLKQFEKKSLKMY